MKDFGNPTDQFDDMLRSKVAPLSRDNWIISTK